MRHASEQYLRAGLVVTNSLPQGSWAQVRTSGSRRGVASCDLRRLLRQMAVWQAHVGEGLYMESLVLQPSTTQTRPAS